MGVRRIVNKMTMKEVVCLLYRARESFFSVQAEVVVRIVTHFWKKAHEIYDAERGVKSSTVWLYVPGLGNIARVTSFRKKLSLSKHGERTWTEKLWIKKPSQWRKEVDNGFIVINGDWWWVFHSIPKPRIYTNKLPIGYEKYAQPVEFVDVGPKSVEQAISEEPWLDPAWLLAYYNIEFVDEEVYLNRSALKVRALPKVPMKARGPEVPFCEADELEVWIDKERGVLLSLSAKSQTSEYEQIQIRKLEFDIPIEEALFTFPHDLKGKLYVVK